MMIIPIDWLVNKVQKGVQQWPESRITRSGGLAMPPQLVLEVCVDSVQAALRFALIF
jgi:hypothetical protein